MKKEIFINENMGETRIAIQEDSKLVEVYVENHENQRMVGNIYKGKVENVLPGMQAAFVDIGYELNAFLPFSEIGNNEYISKEQIGDNNGKNKHYKKLSNIEVDLETNQEIYVQVIKEPFAGKGPRVTTDIAIPGRLLVLIPNHSYIGISKKIWDKYERRRLKKIARKLKTENTGIIMRTVAEGKSEEHIENDFYSLIDNWKKIQKKSNQKNSPVLVYEDMETASSVVRDLLTLDVEKIIIDSKKLYRKTEKYLEDLSPSLLERLELYKLKSPLFESFGIENEIDKLMRSRAWLKSGAYLIIEKTEAMVVVDVNSGRFVGKKLHEDNSLKINLEASREVARQLRLRDLSGLIVIDFIDMQLPENRKKVYLELRKELKKDRAKVAVAPISEFGILEMTRQRIRVSLLDSMSNECPSCQGSGRIISQETLITRIDHWLRRYKSKNRTLRLRLKLHPENAAYLHDEKKHILRSLMWQNFVHLKIEESIDVQRDAFVFLRTKDGVDITNEMNLEKGAESS
ncbi:MAG: ribonuclease G [Candidatus Marinimicrobia bacterium]|nr:ribonuclease G [Candidatus Neomarinimicrobiota bacterium]|tara:strand:+ start:690 stop:2237 length:1548 start_codon:yes stop_codon:yes gene_type:complete